MTTPPAAATVSWSAARILERRLPRLEHLRWMYRLAWAVPGSQVTDKNPAVRLEAWIGLVVTGQPIGLCRRGPERRRRPRPDGTGAPMLTRLLTGPAVTPRDEPIQGGRTLARPPCLKAWKNPGERQPAHRVGNLGPGGATRGGSNPPARTPRCRSAGGFGGLCRVPLICVECTQMDWVQRTR